MVVNILSLCDNIIDYLYILRTATTPSLRDTSPQGEAFKRLPLRGAVNAVNCGVAPLFFRLSRSTGDQWSPLHIFFILSKIIHIWLRKQGRSLAALKLTSYGTSRCCPLLSTLPHQNTYKKSGRFRPLKSL